MRRQNLFSDLKLRLSYGVSGNDAVEPYATQAVLTRIPFAYGEESAPGFAFSDRVGNPDLKWELSYTANLGLDLGLTTSSRRTRGAATDAAPAPYLATFPSI